MAAELNEIFEREVNDAANEQPESVQNARVTWGVLAALRLLMAQVVFPRPKVDLQLEPDNNPTLSSKDPVVSSRINALQNW